MDHLSNRGVYPETGQVLDKGCGQGCDQGTEFLAFACSQKDPNQNPVRSQRDYIQLLRAHHTDHA
jgi:hypothetical protein